MNSSRLARPLLLAGLCLPLLAAGGAAVSFVDFGVGGFLDPKDGADRPASVTTTQDGIALTVSTKMPGATLRVGPPDAKGGGGMGVDAAGKDRPFFVEPGESFELSFDRPGTLVRLRTISGNADEAGDVITATNLATGTTARVELQGKGGAVQDLDLGLAFAAGDRVRVEAGPGAEFQLRRVDVAPADAGATTRPGVH